MSVVNIKCNIHTKYKQINCILKVSLNVCKSRSENTFFELEPKLQIIDKKSMKKLL